MWTVLIQGELANMTELTDGEKNLMLLVCLNGEIKESENTEFRELNTREIAIFVVPVGPPSLQRLKHLL